ncbi:hypothetical protein [Marinobacterium sedimentorum]|uniref:hypothetical protein n=1 Tax=Marinobacterium sedimentorum TaxID=2927804 RepID=UPI0020C6B43A|nr:hypothetical protein [Marinobacterium sedimentorum]MCP8690050.1 hypothetical protein [Marinobacterium sedimentorum]
MDHDENIEIGMCWFDEEQWNLLRELDPEGTDDTYEDWRKNANKAFYDIRASGHKIVKVAVKIDEFLAWCEEKNYEPVSFSRSEYASFKLRQAHEKNKN